MVQTIEVTKVTTNNVDLRPILETAVIQERFRLAGRRGGLRSVCFELSAIALKTLEVKVTPVCLPKQEIRTANGGTRRYNLMITLGSTVNPEVIAIVDVKYEKKNKIGLPEPLLRLLNEKIILFKSETQEIGNVINRILLNAKEKLFETELIPIIKLNELRLGDIVYTALDTDRAHEHLNIFTKSTAWEVSAIDSSGISFISIGFPRGGQTTPPTTLVKVDYNFDTYGITTREVLKMIQKYIESFKQELIQNIITLINKRIINITS